MTRTEALTEARRRWGREAYVHDAHSEYYTALSVGAHGGHPIIKGCGSDWEAAFADADRHQQEAK